MRVAGIAPTERVCLGPGAVRWPRLQASFDIDRPREPPRPTIPSQLASPACRQVPLAQGHGLQAFPSLYRVRAQGRGLEPPRVQSHRHAATGPVVERPQNYRTGPAVKTSNPRLTPHASWRGSRRWWHSGTGRESWPQGQLCLHCTPPPRATMCTRPQASELGLKHASRSPRRAHAVSPVPAEPQACEKRGIRRQDKDTGLRSWLCSPGLTALRRAMMRLRAGRPSTRTATGRPPHGPGGPSTAHRQLRDARASPCGRLRRSRSPNGGVGCARGVGSLAGRGGSSRLRLACASVAPLAVYSWGVVQLGGRRLPACRCSRGRRPTGSDSEATGRPAALPQ